LFQGGRRLFELRQARAGLTAAQANQAWQRYLVDLETKRQYFNVLAARDVRAAVQSQLQQAQQQLRMASLRLRAATATKSDSLRSEIQVSNAEAALIQAETDLATAVAGLTRVVGASEPVTASEDPDLPEVLSFDDDVLVQWTDEGPGIQVAEADLVASRAARTSSFSNYLPSVSASYSRSMSGDGFFFEDGDVSHNGSLRLSLSYPIFDQLNREEQVVRSGAALDNAEAELRDARLAARESLVRILGEYRAAAERAKVQTTSVAAAEEDLRVQQQRYSLGEGTQLDVLASQTQLNEARAALIRARYDRRVARAQLEALVGRDL